ncbi:exosortase family protein XrtF [Flavobacteriaceae bacterium M23B6Z8]
MLLSLLYSYYLSRYDAKPDTMTQMVASQSEYLMEMINYESSLRLVEGESFIRFLVRDTQMGLIVEGCNSLSVIILFLSFIVAFKGSLLRTVIFILIGSVVIYLANLFRIVVLLVGFYEIPAHRGFLHSIVFPLIIYGMVFFMWMVWVTKFARK